MPVAVNLGATTKRYELKSLPEAYVVVKRMSYGESLNRQSMMTNMKIGKPDSKDEFAGQIDLDTRKVALWDFANCVVEHNLTDENERLLNFKDPNDVNKLDSTIGQEIGDCIDEFNSVEGNQDVKN